MAVEDVEQRSAYDTRRLYRPTRVTALALDQVLIELEDGFGASRSVTVSVEWSESPSFHFAHMAPRFNDGLCDDRVLAGIAVAMHRAIGHQFEGQLAADHGDPDHRAIKLDAAPGRHYWNGNQIPESVKLDELATMLAESPPRVWVAFSALAQREDEASLAMLVEQTSSPDPFRRRAAAEAIGTHARGMLAVESVHRLLSDPSPIVVRAAIEAAGKIKHPECHDEIAELLADKEVATRLDALLAIGILWRDRDCDRVIDIAKGDPDTRCRRQASWVLMSHAFEATWRSLSDIWTTSEVPRERAWACQLVARFGSAADRDVLLPLMSDRDGHVREAAERAAGQLDQRSVR